MSLVLGQQDAVPRLTAGLDGSYAEQWAAAKAAVFQGIGYKMYAEEVAAFHASMAPVRIVSAPARTSKSMSAHAEIVALGQPTDPWLTNRTAIVGTDYNTMKEFEYCWEALVLKNDFRKATGATLGHHQFNAMSGALKIELRWPGRDPTGVQARFVIEGKSASNEKSLQGEQWSVIVLSEAAEHEERIWKKYLRTRYWRAIFPTTPKPKADWIKKMKEQGELDPTIGIESFTFPAHANPLYDHKLFAREERLSAIKARSLTGNPHATAADDPYFAEQFLGQWVYYAGKLLPFHRPRHVIDDSLIDLSRCRIFVSIDYGYDHPAVAILWAVDPRGLYIIFDEVKLRLVDSYDLIDSIQKRLKDHDVRADYYTGDPRRPEVAHLLQRLGLPVMSMNKRAQSERAAGHRRLVDLLAEGPVKGYPGLFVAARCKHLVQEWDNLRYKEGHIADEYSKTALEGEDDFYDAGRYGVMTLPGPKGEVEEDVDWIREMMRERDVLQRLHHPETRYPGWAATGESPYG